MMPRDMPAGVAQDPVHISGTTGTQPGTRHLDADRLRQGVLIFSTVAAVSVIARAILL